MRAMSGGHAVGVLVLVAALVAGGARAAADDDLRWQTVDGCGSAAALRARIEVYLGRPLVLRDAIVATVVVVRGSGPGHVEATVRIETRRGEAAREVRGADCAAVIDAVAFVLSSAVTEDGELRPVTPEVAADATVPWIVRPVPVPRVLRSPAPRLGVELALDGWSDAGTLPQLRLGVGGSLALSYGRIRGEVGVSRWDEAWAPFQDAETGPIGLSMTSGSVRGCGSVWRLWMCGGLLFGEMRGFDGVGDPPEKRWMALGFQTRWQRALVGPMGLAASVEGVANLERPALPLQNGRLDHQPAVFALRLGLSVVAKLW